MHRPRNWNYRRIGLADPALDGSLVAGVQIAECSRRMHIDQIQVGFRYRKDLGDLRSLADGIAEVGLLHPVVSVPSSAPPLRKSRYRRIPKLMR